MPMEKVKPKAKMRRPNDGEKGSLKYPPMYNATPEATDQMELPDVGALDSGDPFLNVDAKPDQDETYQYSAPGSSKMSKLRKKGPPPAKPKY